MNITRLFTSLLACVLLFNSSLSAAITVRLSSGVDSPTTTFTYGNLDGTPTFAGGALNNALSVIEDTISDASGSFTVTWEATADSSTADPEDWRFGATGANISPTNAGWGVNGSISSNSSEAFLLTFDLTNFVIDEDHDLVFSIRPNGNNKSLRIYERTGANSGAIATEIASTTPGVFSDNVAVDGLLQFAITDAAWDSGVSNRVSTFRIDVIERPLRPEAVNDEIMLRHGGFVRIPILTNDPSLDLLEQITIDSATSFGTVELDDNMVLYEHTTGTPVSDSFTYTLTDTYGRTSTATATITFSDAVRLSNNNLDVPDAPPVDGLQIEDAFPGISFRLPLGLTSAPGETDRLFVCEKTGAVQIVKNLSGTPTKVEFLDLVSLLNGRPNEEFKASGEGGLLGLAFHPNYAINGLFYIFYSVEVSGQLYQRVSRFSVSGNPDMADGSSEQVLIQQLDDATTHNGGDLQFGPDGYLYISVGDEGGATAAINNGQRIDRDYFSGILRIDVDKLPGNLEPNDHDSVIVDAFGDAYYSVPADNPWIGATSFNGISVDPTEVITEFYAVGFRNPWRTHFDPLTGDYYVADVGQNAREEVNLVTRGGNYGWSFYEGTRDGPGAPAPAGFVHEEPIFEYARGIGEFQGNSVTGGVVYRGEKLEGLVGKYIFSDYVSGNIWSLEQTEGSVNVERILGSGRIADFGYDPSNMDILAANLSPGRIQRIVAAEPTNAYPPTLSATGIFADLATLTPNPGVLHYEPNLAFWSDHAIKDRWFVIPNLTDMIGFSEEDPWTFPSGMVWIKHFEMEMVRGDPTTRKRLETRLLVKNDGGAYGVSYRWNEEETDAYLVPSAGVAFPLAIEEDGVMVEQTWEIPSRAACLICHLPNAGHALSFNTRQLNRDYELGGFEVENQIARLRDAGYLSNAPASTDSLPRHIEPDETEFSLEARVRSYLAVNCAYCHQSSGGNPATFDLSADLTTSATGILNGLLTNYGSDPNNRVVVPGDTLKSVLLQRIQASNGFARMPPLASSQLDEDAINLMIDWITQELPHTFQSYSEWREQQFGSVDSPEGDPAFDADGDSASNEKEWFSRTNPNDANDVWLPSIESDESGDMHLSFDWILNRRLRIEESTDLTNWSQVDTPLNHMLPSSSNAVQNLDIDDEEEKKFYRFHIFE